MISEFTFTERIVVEVYVYLWFLQRAWITDRFEHLKWRRLKNIEMKTIIILSILVVMPIQGTFDSIWMYLKYKEGSSLVIYDGNGTYPDSHLRDFTLVPKLYDKWTKTNYRIKNITEYILCISFALQTATLLLMQLFWNHLAGHWGRSFLVSSEFKVYVAWIFLSIVLFPVSRWVTNDAFPYTEVIPQMIFSIGLIIICLVGLRNQRKLFFLLRSIQHQEFQESTSQETTLQINYFSEMNMLLSGGELLIAIPFLTLGIDALTKKTINNSKFISDFLMIHCNLGSLILWIVMILIIYPRYYMTGLHGSKLLSKKSLSRISHISSGYISKYSDQTIKLMINGNTVNAVSRRNNFSSDAANRLSTSSLAEQQQSGMFRYKTASSIISSTNTLILNGPGIHTPTSPSVGSPTSSPRNYTPLSFNLQRPPPSAKSTLSPRPSSTSLVNILPNHRKSLPLSSRSSANSLPPNLRTHSSSLRTSLSTKSQASSSNHRHKSQASARDNLHMSSASSSYADDEVSYKSYGWSDEGNSADSDEDKDEKNYKQRKRLSFCEEQLQGGTFPPKSPTLKFQLTPPLRPKDHPKDHVVSRSWI